MPIAARKSAAIRAARRCNPKALREFVSHFLTVRGIGVRRCGSRWAEEFIRLGWIHASGRLAADGVIVGRAVMEGAL